MYNRNQAATRALASTSNTPGGCYAWTRTQFGSPAIGDWDGDGDADAVDGWKATKVKHPGDRNPPRGVPVFWSGGSHGYGHAAVSLGDGKIRSTDAGGRGVPATVDLGWVERAWGLTYLGWSEDLAGVTIPPPPPPVKKPRAEKFPGFYHIAKYWINDSIDGLRRGRKLGFKSIDLNFHMTADGIWACTHWGDLRGFRFPGKGKTAGERWQNGKVPTKPISKMLWKDVKRLRTQDGHRIRSAAVMLRVAKVLGYEWVEVEPKDIPTEEQFARLKRHADRAKIQVVIKRLSDIPGAARCLANAHAVDLLTMLLPRGREPIPLAKFSEVDYVRGKVKWS
jgi:hypothetical protein